MLAQTYSGQNPAGWLMSEKLDGVRAIWNGTILETRNGNQIHAPAWFTAALPSVPLDGELWMGRGKFQATVAAVRKHAPDDTAWRQIRYMVFDAPTAAGGFEQRISAAADMLAGCPVAEVVAHEACRSRQHMSEYSAGLIAAGAEGIMLRAAGSRYEMRRSDALLKHKPVFTDEAEVVAYDDGKGRNAGLVGALVCVWNGVRFGVGAGLNDALRATPPKIGALVTFAYNGLTDSGVPRFPTFVMARDYE